jgi:hypothetical protein
VFAEHLLRNYFSAGTLSVFMAIDGLHLRKTAIPKQFRSRLAAAVVGCEKHYGPGTEFFPLGFICSEFQFIARSSLHRRPAR